MNTVTFPGLGGFQLDVNPVAFSVFDKPVYWYGILISLAFLSAIVLALRHCEGFGIKQDDFLDMVIFAGPIGIVGARLYYVIFSWDTYKYDLVEIFRIWNGGLAIYGGIITGVITAYIFARVKKIKPLTLMDFSVVYIPLAQAIGRWGNFFNQEAFGSNTSLPWGMTSDKIKSYLSEISLQGVNVDPLLPVHPTFLYESLWDLAIFFILISRRKKKKADGEVLLLYFALYGLGRFFIEGLRTDSLMVGSLRVSQLLSLLFFIVAVLVIILIRQKASKTNFGDVELGQSEYAGILKSVLDEEKLSDKIEAVDLNTENEVTEKNEVAEKNEDENTDVNTINENEEKG